MSKKGFYEIFHHIINNKDIHYNDVLKHCMQTGVVESRASVTIILNGLTELEIVNRTVSQARPIRTTYNVSKKGIKVMKYLKELEVLF